MTTPLIPPIPPTTNLGSPPRPPEGVQTLQDKFSRLMLNEPAQASHAPSPAIQGSSLSELVRSQENMQIKMAQDMANLVEQAPGMDLQTMSMRQIEMTLQLAQVQTQFTATTSVANNLKSGLQTLMKNQ